MAQESSTEQKDKNFSNTNDELNNQISAADFSFHRHTGIDTPRINPRDLLGFPVTRVADATIAPTDTALEGTFRFYYDTTPRYRLWVRINKGWRVVSLT